MDVFPKGKTRTRKRTITRFRAGSGFVLAPLSRGVIGMKRREHKQFTVPPEHAFGAYRDGLVLEVPARKLPQGTGPGDELHDDTTPRTWKVVDVHDDKAVLDGNHPLAGEELVVDVKVERILR